MIINNFDPSRHSGSLENRLFYDLLFSPYTIERSIKEAKNIYKTNNLDDKYAAISFLVAKGADINLYFDAKSGQSIFLKLLENEDYQAIRAIVDGGVLEYLPLDKNKSYFTISTIQRNSDYLDSIAIAQHGLAKKDTDAISILSALLAQPQSLEREILIEYMLSNNHVIAFSRNDDVIKMDHYGSYSGGYGHDIFIAYPKYIGQKDSYKIVLTDLNYGEYFDQVNLCACRNIDQNNIGNAIVIDDHGATIFCGTAEIYIVDAQHLIDDFSNLIYGDICASFNL